MKTNHGVVPMLLDATRLRGTAYSDAIELKVVGAGLAILPALIPIVDGLIVGSCTCWTDVDKVDGVIAS